MRDTVVAPGTDLRTLITVPVVVAVASFMAIGIARVVMRLLRRWSKFTARSIRVAAIAAPVVVDAINAAMGPRFDAIEAKFDTMKVENDRAHSEVVARLDGNDTRLDSIDGRLDSIDARLKALESQGRHAGADR